jgi:outer membrane protein TolC
MIKKITILVLLLSGISAAQYSLEHYLKQGINNAPTLAEFKNLKNINDIQSELNSAENSAFKVFLSADYLFAPYFNNNGQLISTNPDPNAIGYDVGITNGGLYSAQLNVEKNILNGGLLNALQNQNKLQAEQFGYSYDLEKHNLEKQITDQYLVSYKSLLLFELSKDIISNLSEQLKIASDLVEQGYMKAQNYLLLKIELQNEQINLNEAYQNYKNDLTQLNTICGIKDTNFVSLSQVELSLTLSKSSSDFYKKYELDSLATVNQQSLFETKYLPQLKLFANTGLNAVEINGIQRKFGMSAGLNFLLPIFDGGQKSLTQQQSQITQKTISDYRKYFEANLQMLINNTSSRINSLKNNISDLNEQINEYQKLMELSVQGLKMGDISMIEYLTLLKNFIDLRKNKIEKQVEYQMEINNYNYWNW